MDKRGLSNVVSVILLIALAVVLSFSVYNIVKKQNLEKVQMSMNCIKDVEIEILDACYENNLFNIKIKNKKDIILGDFFLIQLNYQNQTTQLIPSAYHTYIYPYETNTIIIPYYPDLEKIKVIPRIESASYLCMENAPEYENIDECENEN